MHYRVILAQETLANNNFEALAVGMVHQISLGGFDSRRVGYSGLIEDTKRLPFKIVTTRGNSAMYIGASKLFSFQSTQKHDPIAT